MRGCCETEMCVGKVLLPQCCLLNTLYFFLHLKLGLVLCLVVLFVFSVQWFLWKRGVFGDEVSTVI